MKVLRKSKGTDRFFSFLFPFSFFLFFSLFLFFSFRFFFLLFEWKGIFSNMHKVSSNLYSNELDNHRSMSTKDTDKEKATKKVLEVTHFYIVRNVRCRN